MFLRSAKFLIVICLAIAACSFACAALILHSQGYQVLSVQTNSMVPTFSKGDALIVRRANSAELNVGDIISYHSPADPRVVVSHRLASVNYATGKLVTKGDNLDMRDISFPSNQVIGQVIGIVPFLGKLLDWLHEPAGLIVLVYTPAAFILVSEARRLSQQYEKPRFRNYGYNAKML